MDQELIYFYFVHVSDNISLMCNLEFLFSDHCDIVHCLDFNVSLFGLVARSKTKGHIRISFQTLLFELVFYKE
jgi:hypothetical protein